ncbi:hypothetical protein [Bdellovibrio sp.]|uniref:hypothetical protein n=1 Tax=Bdellovibrio sp. TaxID=28201 RepID=UPI0039E41F4A
MKSNLALLNMKESRVLAVPIFVIGVLAIVTDLQFSLKAYLMIWFLFIMSKSEPVEAVQEGFALGLDTKDLIILKRVYMLNNEKFHKRLYYFNRFGTFMLLAGVILHDVLVYLKIIDPV